MTLNGTFRWQIIRHSNRFKFLLRKLGFFWFCIFLKQNIEGKIYWGVG